MKKIFVLTILFGLALSAKTQNTVLQELATYKITPEVLTMTFNEDWPNVSFERHSVSTSPGSDFVYKQVATYDASKPDGEKWTLVSVNDKTPEKFYIKDFREDMNPKKKKSTLLIDEATLKIVKDDDATLLVSFKFIKNSIHHNYSYLADCTSTATISKNAGKLQKLEIINDGPTKLETLKISYVKFDIDYTFNTAIGQYTITRTELNNTGSYLGATASNKTVREYTNFVKLN